MTPSELLNQISALQGEVGSLRQRNALLEDYRDMTVDLVTVSGQMLDYFGTYFKEVPTSRLRKDEKDQHVGCTEEFVTWLNDLRRVGQSELCRLSAFRDS